MEIVGSNPIGVAIQTYMEKKLFVETIIIGAGLSGLAAGRTLLSRDKNFLIVDQKDKIGGKVNTDQFREFKLDYGFQIILDGYKNTKKFIDMDKLHLQFFDSGALIWDGKKFETISDPIKDIRDLPKTLVSPIGTIKDKIKILILKIKLSLINSDKILQMSHKETKTFFKDHGFSKEFITRFLKPFFSGILLDQDLKTPHTYMLYLFKLFSNSKAGVPINGMQEIPNLLAKQIPKENLLLKSKVKKIEKNRIILENNKIIYCKNIICAVDKNNVAALKKISNFKARKYFSCTTHYYSINNLINIFGDQYKTKKIILNGSGKGYINNIAIMSNIAKSYAPKKSNLIAVTTLGKKTESKKIVSELQSWINFNKNDIEHLKSIYINEALPIYEPNITKKSSNKENIIFCGDYLFHPSIEGAISSGMHAGKQIN